MSETGSCWQRGQRSWLFLCCPSGPNKHQSAVTCLQFCRGLVLSSSDDGTVKLWDLKTGAWLRDVVALQSRGSGQNLCFSFNYGRPGWDVWVSQLASTTAHQLTPPDPSDSPQAASCGESEHPTHGWFVLPAAGTELRRLNYWCWTLTWTTWRKTPTE